MNWKRGAFRTWLVLSIFWVLSVGTLIMSLWSSPYPAIPSLDQIDAAAKRGLQCVDYVQGPWNTYAQAEAVENLKEADRNNNVAEARRLALLITRHRDCNELASSYPQLNIIVKTETSNTLNVYALPFGTIEGVPADITAEALSQRIAAFYASERSHELTVSVAQKAALVFLPPIALLTVGMLAAWIIAGFKR